MENSGDIDKFASVIIPHCQPTASQEEKLQSCPLARESEVFSDDIQSSSSSEQATGIIMVSLPESSDEYQTPPEQHSYSQNSGNDDQVPATNTAAIGRDMKSGRVGDGDAMTADDDGEEPPGQTMVDLANDSDILGFSEKSPRVVVDKNDTEQITVERRIHETDAENLVCETSETELISSLKENDHQVFVEMPKRVTIVNTNLNTGKRKLPFSINKEEQNRTQNSREDFIDSLDRVWKMLTHGNDEIEEIDFIETAKRRGLTFPL